jgi:hypothetical protein
MNTRTVLDIIERAYIALNYTKADKDFNENFACGTTEEYKAYLMGQHDTFQAMIGYLQSCIEDQLNAVENSTPE